jgi:hypothetical protein
MMRWAYIVLPPYRSLCLKGEQALIEAWAAKSRLAQWSLARQALLPTSQLQMFVGIMKCLSGASLYTIDHRSARPLQP